ncbi:hypothetical protein WME76_22465 [Sorangium sp. So ce119]|uniref:hypothetical protein n=1 Tax=Sorangium sp. So ce119 TaxID=3133279 RepID=UPI003F63F0A1
MGIIGTRHPVAKAFHLAEQPSTNLASTAANSTARPTSENTNREWTARENKRLHRPLKDARVPGGAWVDDVSCEAARV